MYKKIISKREQLLGLKNGQKIGHFSIESIHGRSRLGTSARPLGEGGSGLVYLASQKLYKNAEIKRAIKFFIYRRDIARSHKTSGPISESHFELEILNLASFNHENIVRVIEAGELVTKKHTIIPFIVYEYVEGPTFEQLYTDPMLLLSKIGIQHNLLLDMSVQLLEGIEHLHSRNFYHCDISPKNIILSGNYPSYRVVITDLGIGHTRRDYSTEQITVIASRAYSPTFVQNLMGTKIAEADFFKLQPAWDMYGAAKTIRELIDVAEPNIGPYPWLLALKSKMKAILKNPENINLRELIDYLKWLRPENREFINVPELTQNFSGNTSWNLPISSVLVSERIKSLANHWSLLRLKQVPQLFLASEVFPSATHTRYEHSLGVYENMRKYLQGLANDKYFLQYFTPAKTELALVGALLSSISRHPFSIVLKEIRQIDNRLFPLFSNNNILDELMNHESEVSGKSLGKVIESGFPLISSQDCIAFLSERLNEVRDPGRRIMHSLLDSSIGVRVIDYLQRDSLHVGVSGLNHLDINDLLPHLFIDEDQLCVRTAGLSVVEEVVSLRYWLFNRVYWNRPSRSYQTMFRHLFLMLSMLDSDFEKGLRSKILTSPEQEILRYCSKVAEAVQRPDILQLCRLFMKPRPESFPQLLEINRSQDDTRKIDTWERISNLSFSEKETLQRTLEEELVKKLSLEENIVHLLIDLPAKPYPIKLGEDINVEIYDKKRLPLERVSGIVDGVKKGFLDHLQRFRIFLNPLDWKYVSDLDAVRKYIEGILVENL